MWCRNLIPNICLTGMECMHAYTRTCMRTHGHTCTQARMYTHGHASTYRDMHAHTETCMHTHGHACWRALSVNKTSWKCMGIRERHIGVVFFCCCCLGCFFGFLFFFKFLLTLRAKCERCLKDKEREITLSAKFKELCFWRVKIQCAYFGILTGITF